MIPPFLPDVNISDAEDIIAKLLNSDYSEDQQSQQSKHFEIPW